MPAELAYEPGLTDLWRDPSSILIKEALRWHSVTLSVSNSNSDKKAILRFNATTRSAPGELTPLVTWTSLASAERRGAQGVGGVSDNYPAEPAAGVNIARLALSKTADLIPSRWARFSPTSSPMNIRA